MAGVGTGGTISGTGCKLKEKNPAIELVAVEPDSSAVISGDKPGPHKLQGIGAGFIPDTLNTKILDRVIRVTNENANYAEYHQERQHTQPSNCRKSRNIKERI